MTIEQTTVVEMNITPMHARYTTTQKIHRRSSSPGTKNIRSEGSALTTGRRMPAILIEKNREEIPMIGVINDRDDTAKKIKKAPCCPGKVLGNKLLAAVAKEAGETAWLEAAEAIDPNAGYELGTALLAEFFSKAIQEPELKAFYQTWYAENVGVRAKDFDFALGSYSTPSSGGALPCPSKVVGRNFLIEAFELAPGAVKLIHGARFVDQATSAMLTLEGAESITQQANALLRSVYKDKNYRWMDGQNGVSAEDYCAINANLVQLRRSAASNTDVLSRAPTFVPGFSAVTASASSVASMSALRGLNTRADAGDKDSSNDDLATGIAKKRS